MKLIQKTRNWYGRFERPISSLSLLSGFIFDILTLKRLDTLWENLWIFGHILIIGIFIILIHFKDYDDGDEKNTSKAHFWYVNILQFMFGGVLSTFLVFYFRSADLWNTWPFLIILLFAFIANESFKRHYIRLSFQISLFYLSIYSFLIFLIPVLLHKIGTEIFIISGILSLIIIFFFIKLLFYFTKNNLKESKKLIAFLIISIYLVINILYFTNLIPPIPLSLKDADIYHNIVKQSDGNYIVNQQKKDFFDNFKIYKDIQKNISEPLFAYSAIFSPNNLNITIVHEWQYYDLSSKKWKTDKKIQLNVIGGRGGGFRTYSKRTYLRDGKWKVNIKTLKGQTIGQIRFNVKNSPIKPELIPKVNY